MRSNEGQGQLAELRNDVAERERDLRVALAEFGAATRQSFTPASWIRERPVACFLFAMTLGFWLGMRIR